MATQFELTVGAGVSEIETFDLPVPLTFGQQSDTYISILAIQPDPLQPPVTATYEIEHVASADHVTVPAAPGMPVPIGTRATVELQSLANGLAVIHIHHNTPIDPDDEEPWRLTISHNGATATGFFGVVGHTLADTQAPRMMLIIGSALDPNPAELDFGLATFSVSKTLSVVVFNTGTADLVLDTITLTTNPSGFYSISTDPSGNTVSPNGQDPIAVDYAPVPPGSGSADTAQLSIPSATAGVATRTVAITGQAVFREIVLCIDASNSMNWDNSGNPLAGCPVSNTRAPNFDPDSRIRQVRAALQVFQTKLIEYGDGQSLTGIAQFPGGDLACGSSHNDALASQPSTWSAVIQSLTPFHAGTSNLGALITTATDDGYYHSTPMKAGLETSIALFSPDPGSHRAILLLSDGAHNVPTGSSPLDLLPTLTSAAKPIRVLAIGFGESVSVDHPKLQQLASQTNPGLTGGGFFAYNPAVPGNTESLEGFYNKLFTDIFALQEAVDPTAWILPGETQTHPVRVTEFDQRITFAISWRTPQRNLLGLELIAPNGERIGPKSPLARYYQGPKHKMYAVDVNLLSPAYVGEWTMEVTRREAGPVIGITAVSVGGVGGAGGDGPETYSYDVITRSGLEMAVRFDKPVYRTGDRMVISAQLTENGRPLLNQTVKVQVRRPDQGMGNWFADHPVSFEAIEKAVAEQLGPNSAAAVEKITPVFKKQFYLTRIGSVDMPPSNPVFPADGIDMTDDGLGGDPRAQDGIYTADLGQVTTKTDTYAFKVVATGTTSGGTPFRRERTIHVNVQPQIDFTLQFTQVDISFIPGSVVPGRRRFKASIRPQDRLGNLWGPGHGEAVRITCAGARPITPVEDDLNGRYTRIFEIAEGSPAPLVEFEIDGRSVPPQIVDIPGQDRQNRLLLLLSASLFLALIIILLLVLAS